MDENPKPRPETAPKDADSAVTTQQSATDNENKPTLQQNATPGNQELEKYVSVTAIVHSRTPDRKKSSSGCEACGQKMCSCIPPKHAGLPCGHRVDRDSCNVVESIKSCIETENPSQDNVADGLLGEMAGKLENISLPVKHSSKRTATSALLEDLEFSSKKLPTDEPNTHSKLGNYLPEGYLREGAPPLTQAFIYTAAQYPNDYNSLIPPMLQRQLDGMAPQAFLTFILTELKPKERESLMADEQQRRKTFLGSWPHDGNKSLSGVRMAKAGLYYVNDEDRVQCAFCQGTLASWKYGNIPMDEHRKQFKLCKFVKGQECGNRKCEIVVGKENLRRVTFYNSYLREMANKNLGDYAVVFGMLGINQPHANHKKYATEPVRLGSYEKWPANYLVSELCSAGFYYTGTEDQVQCFYCSGKLKGWSDDDDPWMEHARWFPDCTYLNDERGYDYINRIHEETPDNKKSVRDLELEKRAELIKNEHDTADVDNPTEDKENDAGSASTTTAETARQPTVKPDKYAGGNKCRSCNEVLATHIGLPCGHVSYCGPCNAEKQRLSIKHGHKPTCVKCGTQLLASMQFYLG